METQNTNRYQPGNRTRKTGQGHMTELNPIKPNKTKIKTIAIVVFAILCISSAELWTLQPPKPKDEFTQEIDEALKKNNRNITVLLRKYIKTGDSFEATKKFLESRDFKIHKLAPKPGEPNTHEYYARRKKIKNLVILTSTNIIITTDGDTVKKVTGAIGLTGL